MRYTKECIEGTWYLSETNSGGQSRILEFKTEYEVDQYIRESKAKCNRMYEVMR